MTEHAPFFQASSAARWIACPGSVKLCDGLPDESSAYAEEGTMAHELAARMLTEKGFYAEDLPNTEMAQHIVDYVQAVYKIAGVPFDAHPRLVEQRVDFSHVLAQPDCFGTADVIVLAGDEIQIHDLKYGMGVKVDATENPQLMLYALGALHQFEALGPFKTARLCIHQVRLDHFSDWVVTVEDLIEFGKKARAAAEEALSAKPALQPTEKGCRFCRAKGNCTALATFVEETIGQRFENLDAEELKAEPDSIGLNRLSHAMSAVELVEIWCKGVRARTERELLAGQEIDGWKLVQGKKGNRKWSSDQEAEAQLRKMKLKVEQIYSLKVISPTTAEKLAKAGTIGPRQWPALKTLITQSEGGLSVAPASDPRPAATPVAPAEAFDNLEIA